MKLLLSFLLVVLAISATGASAQFWQVVGQGVGTGLSADGVAVSYHVSPSAGAFDYYIYSKANGAYKVGNGTRGSIGVAQIGTDYAVVYNSAHEGFSKAYTWKGNLLGVGTTTGDPFSTSTTATFEARGVAGTAATEAYVAGSRLSAGLTLAARWKAPAGSVATYAQPSNFANTLYYLYSASNSGSYAGWGRLTSGSGNRAQAMVLDGSLKALRNGNQTVYDNAWYSNAYISLDGQTCMGWTGPNDGSGAAMACYWNRGAAFSDTTPCNLIPYLTGYTKAYAMKGNGNLVAGWTIKASGQWGVDRRTIFLYDKTTNQVQDLRAILTAAGIDMSQWGLMDITGVSNNGRILSGTMVASTNAYWTAGTSPATNDYYTWMVDLDAPVPEPGSMLALATGLIGLVGVIRRRK